MKNSIRSLIRKIILENDSHLDVFDPSVSSKEEFLFASIGDMVALTAGTAFFLFFMFSDPNFV